MTIRILRLSLVFLTAILVSVQATAQALPQATAQTPPLPAPVRDQVAVAAIQNSIAALGGAGAIGQVRDAVMHGQFAAGVSSMQSGSITWKTMGAEALWNLPTAHGRSTMSSGHGSPFMAVNGAKQSVGPHISVTLFAPPLVGQRLLRILQNTNCSVIDGGTSTLNGSTVQVVKTVDVTNNVLTPQTWYFDAATMLPVRLRYREPDIQTWRAGADAGYDFSNYQAFDGILIPTALNWTLGGTQVASITLTKVQINSGFASSDFDDASGGVQ